MAEGSRPTLRLERRLLRSGISRLACCDEVGRGALAGPVTIGVVVVTARTTSAPPGVRDSKLLSPASRESLAPQIRSWADACAVGHASAAEIDQLGIVAAMRLAGVRALAQVGEVDAVLLDGSYDYLSTPPQPTLFDGNGASSPAADGVSVAVTTLVKADLNCSAVAAASILAKTERDGLLADLSGQYPGYGWEHNKGYGSADHIEALALRGPTVEHRRSWRLPGVGG